MKNYLTLVIVMVLAANLYAQRTVSPAIFEELLQKETDAQLLDVRTSDEYRGGHLDKAQNLDCRSSNFGAQAEKLDRNRPVFVYCLSGGRSANAASKLTEMGFKQVYNLQGGIMTWKNAGKAVTTSSNPSDKSGMSKAEFEKATTADVPVLVDFFAPWCAPCKKMSPMLDELLASYPAQFKLLKLNADQNELMMKAMAVTEIPTFFLFKDGKLVWTHVGLVEREELVSQMGLN
jgi:thioredoxin